MLSNNSEVPHLFADTHPIASKSKATRSTVPISSAMLAAKLCDTDNSSFGAAVKGRD